MNNHYDLIVVGGGFSGVCAAISAAKEGLNTLLIERYNCLGGAAANDAFFGGFITSAMEPVNWFFIFMTVTLI